MKSAVFPAMKQFEDKLPFSVPEMVLLKLNRTLLITAVWLIAV